MSKNLSRILTLVTGVIGLIGFFFFIRVMMAGDEAIENDAAVQASIVSPFVTFARLLLIFTAGIAVLFSIWNLIKQPQVLKRSLIAVGLLAVVLAVSYVLASDAQVTDTVGRVLEGGEAGAVSKWVSTGINFSAILGGVGLLFFVLDFGRSLVK
ncbi:hypothetical protein R3X25_02670 [Lutibacter sp. TH_r2]|uniref:hypothetical protein n=1 Tax=Lutibacter sp. TH_r2 TaxID=3082083 RepID=UPI002954D6B9|nr:hypothetical protein [Lutibacter sp. TH_r2]MDV7186172.1 hypothetical protein [Lutibacter sp. TH_r2]